MNKFTEHWPVKRQIEKKRNINLARDSQTQILELQQTRREKKQETAKRIDEANCYHRGTPLKPLRLCNPSEPVRPAV